MNNSFLVGGDLPFCRGCGHGQVSQNTEKALQRLGYDPLDVILVTDIGCHGIIDKSFLTHTVHGLHGRAVALAAGLSAGVNDPQKKVIAFIGDGGATIGMQHLVGAAHFGFDLTVVIHNNMLYGMTGGQPSDFTPCGFKTPTHREGKRGTGYDICELLTAAGASYVSRIYGIGDFSDALAEAFSQKGFSVVEIMEICPSYGVKSNPGMKLKKVVEEAGLEVKVFTRDRHHVFGLPVQDEPPSLFGPENRIRVKYASSLSQPMSLMLCGSAGKGTQVAAELLARAAVMSNLYVTKKGAYPVTVGVGFSASEIIVSPERILCTGASAPDALLITSEEGLEFARPVAARMKTGVVYAERSLPALETGAEYVQVDFNERAGERNGALSSIFWFLKKTGILPIEALIDAFNENKISRKVSVESLVKDL
jgi:2-oxoglutarate/2-oxoacid ferredoxin oxidoreductase subunit beta